MRSVRWAAFVGAAILAPILPALPALALIAAFGQNDVMVIPVVLVVAVPMGAPTFLLFGLPAFIYAILRMNGRGFWFAGLSANIASTPAVFAFFWIKDADAAPATAIVIGFGCIFASLWGLIFGHLYCVFCRKGDQISVRAAASRGAQ